MDVPKDSTKAVKKLSIHSDYQNNVTYFDNGDSFPDVKLCIPGIKDPICLHRSFLAKASVMFMALFRGQINPHCNFDEEKHRSEWIDGKASSDEMYRKTLVKWLRFCYGEDQTFSVAECPAALAVLLQLQLQLVKAHIEVKYQEQVKAQIEAFMIDAAKDDVEVGTELLRECAVVYDECHNDAMSRIDMALAKTVMTWDNMRNNMKVVVDSCLMELPSHYLDCVEYKEEHGPLSEFAIRRNYVVYHGTTLKDEERCDILKRCDLGRLNGEELKELYELGMFNQFSFMERCHEQTIQRIVTLEKKMEQITEMFNAFKASPAPSASQSSFPRTNVFLTLKRKDQGGIKTFADNNWHYDWTVIEFQPCGLTGDLRWDSEKHQLFVGSTGLYLVTGRVALYGLSLNCNMNLLIRHNTGASDYRVSSKACGSGNNYNTYVPVYYTMALDAGDYLTFECNVTNNKSTSGVWINGGSSVYTMIEVTRIA